MTIKEVIELMSQMKGVVSSHTMKTAQKILALATAYSYLGAKFTFDANEDLDQEVNNLLIQLSDAVLDEMESRARTTVAKEDEDDSIAYIYAKKDGVDIIERTDSHSTHLKYLLEAYFAVKFANKATNADILGDLFQFLANPYAYALMKDAFDHYNDYRSPLIWARGFHYGKGVQLNPVNGITTLVQDGINKAFQKGSVLSYKRSGAIGYKVHRNSTYDCPICDELCVGIHPLTEIVLPAHPRCCCYTTPVYETDI